MSFDPTDPKARSVRTKYSAAFQEPANLIGLAVLFAGSVALLTPIPLVAAIVAETVYMLFVPDSNWFAQRLAAKFSADVIAHRTELRNRVFPKVRPEVQDRFLWLENARKTIENAGMTQDDWFREALRKLDFLMEKYLQFADREAEFINYLFSLVRESYSSFSQAELRNLPNLARTPYDGVPSTFKLSQEDIQSLIDTIANHYDQEMKNLEASVETESVFATKEIQAKRKDVLARRKEFVVRLSDMMMNLRHQMELIAETFGLINDELRARSPEQVLADIDDVVMQSTSLTDALDSVTPADQLVAKMDA